ncbi:MAG: hypothetical protein P8P32_10725 [Akkermansiaceae bacterium]|nr:hypothetical protein [Akkermansiaceae bacterium]MDG2323654.1 hypothetical protein [Akkermansiaceae bacterium]
MNQQTQTLRHFLVALFAALWIHVGLIFVFILLLIFDVLSGKEIVSDESENEIPPEDDFSELVLTFEEDPPTEIAPVEEDQEADPDTPIPEPNEKFARTRDDQMSDAPIKAEFIGERDTRAASDEKAVAGDRKSVALSGELKERKDNQTFNSTFSDGDTTQNQTTVNTEEIDTGKDQKTEDSSEASNKEMTPEKELVSEDKTEDFVDLDRVTTTIEDAMEKDKKAANTDSEMKPAVKVMEKKKAASRDGGFNSQTSKTMVKGVLSAKGIGALDVKNSAVGAYGSHIFKEIEREWQMGNYKYRSLISPGQITLYFVVNKKGRVYRQRQVEMRGASGTQWGIVLNSVTAAKIPPMSKDVINELGGEDLELTMGFTYN